MKQIEVKGPGETTFIELSWRAPAANNPDFFGCYFSHIVLPPFFIESFMLDRSVKADENLNLSQVRGGYLSQKRTK